MNIRNKRATHEYDILSTLEAGIVLTGAEVKSLRAGHASLEGSYVKIVDGEAFLINAMISPYAHALQDDYDPKRTRKLLLHKKELISLQHKLDTKNLTMVPLEWYTIGSRIKLKVGVARGKKQYEKREALKRKAVERDVEREWREKVK